ncbi:unnamed protein product [Arabis nemorensis]|uniref:Uncharacterized protein n=1 Tax=Arabis nemorensis TaxID=586526 RepID=A0A565BC15_9BRAS|nr:unnamed protein product [Arabis nemorensis]
MAPYGRQKFRSDNSNLGYGANLRGDESYESLMGNVKRRYLLEGTTSVALTYSLLVGLHICMKHQQRRRVSMPVLSTTVLAQVGPVMVATERTSENLVIDLDGDDAMDVVINGGNGITEQANEQQITGSNGIQLTQVANTQRDQQFGDVVMNILNTYMQQMEATLMEA